MDSHATYHFEPLLFEEFLDIFLTLVLLNPVMSCLCKQCRSRSVGFWSSEEASRSGSALFAIKYVNLYQQSGSSNLIGWNLEMGVASIYSAGQRLTSQVKQLSQISLWYLIVPEKSKRRNVWCLIANRVLWQSNIAQKHCSMLSRNILHKWQAGLPMVNRVYQMYRILDTKLNV